MVSWAGVTSRQACWVESRLAEFSYVMAGEALKMIYKWKISKYNLDAQKAGEELERIRNKYGELSACDIVEESRHENAVLHNCFEWRNDIAAQKYREHQAQDLIRNIVVEAIEDKEVNPPIRAYVKIQKDYKPIQEVVTVKDYRDELLQTALKDLKSFKTKYNQLKELSNVFKAIDEVN